MSDTQKNAFTVVELAMILVLLVLLARLAIPAYQEIGRQARAASVRAVLDEVRSALKAYRSNERLEGRAENWPDILALRDQQDQGGSCPARHIFTDCDMPDNVLCGTTGAMTPCGDNRDQITTGAVPARTIDTATTAGWIYDQGTGLFYANTNAMGENGW